MKNYSLNKLEIDSCPVDLSIPCFFQLSPWTSLGKSVNSAGKSVFKLVAKFYKRLYDGTRTSATIQTPVNFRNFVELYLARSKRIILNLGNFTNFKAFFPVLSTRRQLFERWIAQLVSLIFMQWIVISIFRTTGPRGGSRIFLRSWCTTKELPFLRRLT